MARGDPYARAICDASARPPFRVPMPDAPPDLDMRPGEPARATLPHWIRTCRSCRAAAPDLAALPLSAAEVVRSEHYQWLDRHAAHVRPFLRWARLCPAQDRGKVFLMAAWSEDDAGNTDAAATLRRRAIRAWGAPDSVADALRLVDMMRRAADWERAAQYLEQLAATPLDPNSTRIVWFQRARIAGYDSLRHTLGGVLPPPANQPHVSHGRQHAPMPDRKGWLDRLLRRSGNGAV